MHIPPSHPSHFLILNEVAQKYIETGLKYPRVTRILQRHWSVVGATTNQSNRIGKGGLALASH